MEFRKISIYNRRGDAIKRGDGGFMGMRVFVTVIAAGMLVAACGREEVTVVVANDSDLPRLDEVVELEAGPILSRLESEYCNVLDAEGNVVVSQVTADGCLLFRASADGGSATEYRVIASDTLPVFDRLVSGRVYPERADDIAWENESIGFRIYGPATQRRGEKAFGYDIFFKHPTERQVLEELYAAQTSQANWHKADSLRTIDKTLAEEFVNSFTYHIDHGAGMDCYAVGPTLGAGVAAIEKGDSICFPWCYERAEVTDNGPLRFRVRLDFVPVAIGRDTTMTEHRIITLDAGSHLNECLVWYDGLTDSVTTVAGFPRRDHSEAVTDAERGIIAYADPTQGPDNGKAMLGIVLGREPRETAEAHGHILVRTKIAPTDTLAYDWGFAWDRADIKSMEDWKAYLTRHAAAKSAPLRIEVR